MADKMILNPLVKKSYDLPLKYTKLKFITENRDVNDIYGKVDEDDPWILLWKNGERITVYE